MATVPGIDVSYWQSGIDWPKVRATGQRFVMVKATEGATYTDPTFNDDWSGAKLSGLLRAPYCFFHPVRIPRSRPISSAASCRLRMTPENYRLSSTSKSRMA